MTHGEYTHLLSVLSDLAQQFSTLEKKMETGFEELREADQQILNILSESFQNHEHRITRLENVVELK